MTRIRMLNLGCGVRVSRSPEVANLDWSPYLRIASLGPVRWLAARALDRERRERLLSLPENIQVANLSKGIPFPDESVDVVYHSHLLEHLDRAEAKRFMREIYRVLKPGGIQRIVVPDLEKLIADYQESKQTVDAGEGDPTHHDQSIEPLLEQSVRREAYGTAQRGPLRRWLENRLLGDARKRGETHQWMYDRVNLGALLEACGFDNLRVMDASSSGIPDWESLGGPGLDREPDGSPYKQDSLYMEASRSD